MGFTSLVGVVFFPCAQTVHAQNTSIPGTSSGRLLQQNQSLLAPAPANKSSDGSEDGGQTTWQGDRTPSQTQSYVNVRRFVLDQTLPEPASTHVRQLFSQVEGRRLSFSEVARVRAALNTVLRTDMDVLTYAVLPPQEVDDGTVRFEIHHGRIEKVLLKNDSLVSDATLTRFLPATRPDAAGEAPSLSDVEHTLRRMTALPGVARVQSALAPGQSIGTTDVTLQATADARVNGVLVADNSGSATAGRNRVGAQLFVNSPLGFGDQFQSLLFYAPPKGQARASSGGDTAIGQLTYDVPLGYTGMRGGAAYAQVHYRQGGPNRQLFEANGTAEVAGVYLSKPLIDHDGAQLAVGATIDYKRLRDGFFEVDSKRHSIVSGVKASGYRQAVLAGKPNAVQFDASVQTGYLTQAKLGLFDSEDFPTAGHFSKFNGNVLYAQGLPAGFTASVKGSAQLASRHLDGSEQMSLSGLQAVRGYGPELLSVDRGAVVQASLSRSIDPVPGLSASVFYDHGRGQINKQQALGGVANTFTVRAAGVGLGYQSKRKVTVNVTWAKRIGVMPEGQPVSPGSQVWILPVQASTCTPLPV
ncbi:ShlB/FhaC/HecB family hemolysin secretion/activation protein [Dyella sp.]|uniref:ShlB/FhaC/HecB family hemolysin secretion/activation protein n=1 Tax=Dyella sp. TaxID=1869338 RepID=UPI002FD9FFF7